jgi:hypothetical protein
MKNILLIFLVCILFNRSYSQNDCQCYLKRGDSLKIRFEFEEKNRDIRITFKDNVDSIWFQYKTTKQEYVFEEYLPCMGDDCKLAQFYVWVKRKYWPGWQRFYIISEIRRDRTLVVFRSYQHKYKYRYTSILGITL